MSAAQKPLDLMRRAAGPAVALIIIAYFLGAAVIGDNGTGKRPQYELADRMAAEAASVYALAPPFFTETIRRSAPTSPQIPTRQPRAPEAPASAAHPPRSAAPRRPECPRP